MSIGQTRENTSAKFVPKKKIWNPDKQKGWKFVVLSFNNQEMISRFLASPRATEYTQCSGRALTNYAQPNRAYKILHKIIHSHNPNQA